VKRSWSVKREWQLRPDHGWASGPAGRSDLHKTVEGMGSSVWGERDASGGGKTG